MPLKNRIPAVLTILWVLSIELWGYSREISLLGFRVFVPELVFLAFVMTGVPLLLTSRKRIDRKYLFWPAGLFALMVLSSFFSLKPVVSLKESLRWGEMFAAFILVAHLTGKTEEARSILIAFLLSGFFYAAWGLAASPPLADLGSGQSTPYFNNPNQLALYLDFCFPLSVAFFFEERKPLWKTGWGLCTLVIGLSLSLTLSRGSWVSNGCVLGILLLLFFYQKSGNKRSIRWLRRIGFYAFTGFIVLFFGALFLAAFAPGLTEELLKRSESGVLSGLSSRFYGYAAGYRMIEDFPLTGVGRNLYRETVSRYFPVATPEGHRELFVSTHLHNLYLMMAVESGLLTLTAFLFFLYRVAKDTLASLSDRKGEAYWLLAGAGGGALSWLLHNLIDAGTSFMGVQCAILLGLCIGLSGHRFD